MSDYDYNNDDVNGLIISLVHFKQPTAILYVILLALYCILYIPMITLVNIIWNLH
jgi:hypothetical protein